jgi:hypothetical protein
LKKRYIAVSTLVPTPGERNLDTLPKWQRWINILDKILITGENFKRFRSWGIEKGNVIHRRTSAVDLLARQRMKTTKCATHGEQGIGLVCKHVAFALTQGERVGFYWGDDADTARPDAWCRECEKTLVALNGASSENWFKNAEFKILCAACWDEAKAVCGGFTN